MLTRLPERYHAEYDEIVPAHLRRLSFDALEAIAPDVANAASKLWARAERETHELDAMALASRLPEYGTDAIALLHADDLAVLRTIVENECATRRAPISLSEYVAARA